MARRAPAGQRIDLRIRAHRKGGRGGLEPPHPFGHRHLKPAHACSHGVDGCRIVPLTGAFGSERFHPVRGRCNSQGAFGLQFRLQSPGYHVTLDFDIHRACRARCARRRVGAMTSARPSVKGAGHPIDAGPGHHRRPWSQPRAGPGLSRESVVVPHPCHIVPLSAQYSDRVARCGATSPRCVRPMSALTTVARRGRAISGIIALFAGDLPHCDHAIRHRASNDERSPSVAPSAHGQLGKLIRALSLKREFRERAGQTLFRVTAVDRPSSQFAARCGPTVARWVWPDGVISRGSRSPVACPVVTAVALETVHVGVTPTTGSSL